MSYRRKCPTLARSLCPCSFCFHAHPGFERLKLTSLWRDLSLGLTFCSLKRRRISLMERRPDCGRLGMGSFFSFPDTCSPTYYTHICRLCKVENEGRRGRHGRCLPLKVHHRGTEKHKEMNSCLCWWGVPFLSLLADSFFSACSPCPSVPLCLGGEIVAAPRSCSSLVTRLSSLLWELFSKSADCILGSH